MSYRDDVDAAHARTKQLEDRVGELEEENARLRVEKTTAALAAQLNAPLAAPLKRSEAERLATLQWHELTREIDRSALNGSLLGPAIFAAFNLCISLPLAWIARAFVDPSLFGPYFGTLFFTSFVVTFYLHWKLSFRCPNCRVTLAPKAIALFRQSRRCPHCKTQFG